MDRRLIIKKFGPIPELDIQMKPFMVFIGGQGTGKSTIAKIVSIFNDVIWQLAVLENGNTLDSFKQFGIHEYFNPNSYLEYCNGNFTIKYENGGFSITCLNRTQEEQKKALYSLLLNSYKHVLDNFNKDYSNGIDNEFISNNLELFRANSRQNLYMPAERNLVGIFSSVMANVMLAKIPLPNLLLEYMGLFERAKKEFPMYDIPFLRLSFKKKDSQENVIVHCIEGDKELSLNACSSGIQSVLPLLMVLDYVEKYSYFDFFVIEEPEQNLFPENQMELLHFLIRKFHHKTTNQMIINTHSPYILSVLNISIMASIVGKDNAKKVRMLLQEDLQIKPDNIGAYSLGENTKEGYCKNLIDENSGLISQNYLDSVSDKLSMKFDEFYKLYLRGLNNNERR